MHLNYRFKRILARSRAELRIICSILYHVVLPYVERRFKYWAVLFAQVLLLASWATFAIAFLYPKIYRIIQVGPPPKSEPHYQVLWYSLLVAATLTLFFMGLGARWKAEIDGKDPQESIGAL